MMRTVRQSIRAFFAAIPASALVWGLLTTATGIVLLFYRRRLILQLHLDVARLVGWLTATHPFLARGVHIAKDITPDVSFLLLSLAGLAYLMPDLTKRLERKKIVRVTIACIFLFFAISTVVLNEVDRQDKEGKAASFEGTLKLVASQNGDILKEVIANREIPEIERRKRILTLLRNEYVLSHPDASAAMLAGLEYPPTAWIDQRLHELGEKWAPAEVPQKQPTTQIVREVLPEPKKATIQFSFYQDTSAGFPFTEITVPADEVKVTVNVTAKVTNDVAAQRGQIWLRVPETSGWMSEPEGFTKDPNKPKDRSLRFDLMLPNVVLPKIELKVLIPMFPHSDNFQIAGYYGCENCDPVNPGHPQILTVHIAHPKPPKQ